MRKFLPEKFSKSMLQNLNNTVKNIKVIGKNADIKNTITLRKSERI